MPTTALQAADIADNLASLTEAALDDARIAQEHLERLEDRLREIGTQLNELRDDSEEQWPYVLEDLGKRFIAHADDIAGIFTADGDPNLVRRDVGELLEMLHLGASRLRRAAGDANEVAGVER